MIGIFRSTRISWNTFVPPYTALLLVHNLIINLKIQWRKWCRLRADINFIKHFLSLSDCRIESGGKSTESPSEIGANNHHSCDIGRDLGVWTSSRWVKSKSTGSPFKIGGTPVPDIRGILECERALAGQRKEENPHHSFVFGIRRFWQLVWKSFSWSKARCWR